MLKLIAFTFALTSAGGAAHEPTAPAPPAAPTAPKVSAPEAPTAPKKGEERKPADAKGEATVETAEKPAGKADKKAADKKAPRSERASAPQPPSLSGSALRQELKQNGGEDRSAPLSERQRLEQLAADITRAREALKQDTARLETMLRGGGGGDMRMPIGDPTEPMPAGTPTGAAASKEAMREQILTVSKAMKGMKPEQAAAIIARLDRVLASEILRRMKATDAGAVMAAIKPELAAELATAIAMRKSIVDGDPKKDGKK